MGQENFEAMRKAMVASQLRTSDVSSPRLIKTMSNIPREDFVPDANRSFAYSDRGVSIGEGRHLNAPLATGRLLNAAELAVTDNVLLIGAATGYTAVVIAKLAGSVVAVEESPKLAAKAKNNLSGFDNVTVHCGPHAKGFAENAPYSLILIDGIVEQVSPDLARQLAPDGRLVAAIIDDGVARLAIGYKGGDTIGYQFFADSGGIALPGFEKAKGFSF